MSEEGRKYQRGETVPCWADDKTWLGAALDPSQGIKITITEPEDPDTGVAGVVKVGDLSVVASDSFAVGLVVTGATSGATGYIFSKPDATTLRLQRVTGVFQSGEVITDTATGTSTTTSVLMGSPMAYDADGLYVYYYPSQLDDRVGWWTFTCTAIDGTSPNERIVITEGGFELE
jgi:predicted RecA/RadA family phage recombinase